MSFDAPSAGQVVNKSRCQRCGNGLKEEAVLAMGKLWHPDHFQCEHCRQPIKQTFQEHRGHPYCVSCYADKFNPKCAGCGKTLQETCVVAMDKHWHQTCFVCTTCKMPFPSGEYYLVNEEPYDLDCHWARRLDRHLDGAQHNNAH